MRKLAAFVLSLVCALYIQAMALAAAPVAKTQFFAIAATDQTVSLGGTFRTVQIWTDSGAADVYVELNNNTATVGGATTIKIQGGGSWQSPTGNNLGISSFHYIGSAATGNMSVAAF